MQEMKGKEQMSEGSTFKRDFQKLWIQIGLLWGPGKKGHRPRVMEQMPTTSGDGNFSTDTVTNGNFRYFHISLQLLQISQKIIIFIIMYFKIMVVIGHNHLI